MRVDLRIEKHLILQLMSQVTRIVILCLLSLQLRSELDGGQETTMGHLFPGHINYCIIVNFSLIDNDGSA